MKTTRATARLILAASAAALCALSVTSARADTFGSGANAFTISFVTIGDPGNPVDTGTTGVSFSSYGAVGYTFRMGTYEISTDMVYKAGVAGAPEPASAVLRLGVGAQAGSRARYFSTTPCSRSAVPVWRWYSLTALL